MQMIVINTQFEGFHKYPQAPEEVSFLKDLHRHIFHVEVQIEVFHDDRELEIIMVKRALTKFLLQTVELGITSCEMLCKWVQDWVKSTYPTPASQYARVVHVKVMEDGENGAMLYDENAGPFVQGTILNVTNVAEPIRKQEFIAAIADKVAPLKPVRAALPNLQKYIDDVQDLDKKFGLDTYPELTSDNLMFYTTALIGEAGEVANVVKKIVRDGESKELWESLDFEMVDIMIYFIKFLIMTGTDFDSAWEKKHEELRGRYTSGKTHLSYGSRKLERN